MRALYTGCSKVEPKKIRPTTDPLLGAQDGQNLISWNGHYLYLQTQFGEDQCTQFRVIVVTDTQTNIPTHTQTDRTDYNTLCTTAQCKYC